MEVSLRCVFRGLIFEGAYFPNFTVLLESMGDTLDLV